MSKNDFVNSLKDLSETDLVRIREDEQRLKKLELRCHITAGKPGKHPYAQKGYCQAENRINEKNRETGRCKGVKISNQSKTDFQNIKLVLCQ
jgi:hypothetical protein